MEVNEEGKKNKEINEGRLDSFQKKKCVEFFSVALIIYVEMNIFFHSILN